MFSKTVTLVNPQGIHMRPANLFVAEVNKFSAPVTVVHNGNEIPGNSLMAIMAAGIKCGDFIEIKADGDDEQAAVEAVAAFVESGMGD